mgnify:CR=1 FL=1
MKNSKKKYLIITASIIAAVFIGYSLKSSQTNNGSVKSNFKDMGSSIGHGTRNIVNGD